jgi:Berberine and berberine like
VRRITATEFGGATTEAGSLPQEGRTGDPGGGEQSEHAAEREPAPTSPSRRGRRLRLGRRGSPRRGLAHGFDAAANEGARALLSDSWALVRPSGSGGVYANFPDPDLPDEHRAYWGGNLERVRRVKENYDPEGVLG